MKKVLLISCLLAFSLICTTQDFPTKKTNMPDYETLLANPQDTVILSGGWRSRYLERPLYIVNKDYVVYQCFDKRKIIYPDIASFRRVERTDECPIAVDKNGIYYQDIFIKSDTAGISIVGRNNDYSNYQWLWKTKDRVFNNDKELFGIDAETFMPIECLNGNYFKDKNSVYYFDKKIEGSDGSSVSKSCNEMCYDKNYVYVNGEILLRNGQKVKPVNNALAKTDTEVFGIYGIEPIPGIDAASLTKLSRMYSMDKNHVYYGGTIVPIATSNLKNVRVWDQVNRAYVSDGIKVYSREGESGVPEGALDAKTFAMLPHSDFIYDKNGVYERDWNKRGNKLILAKFPFKYTELVNSENMFITDNSRYIVYLNQAYDPWDKEFYPNVSDKQVQELKEGGFLSQKDLKTQSSERDYIPLGNYYSKKGNEIYMFREQLPEIEDPATFEPLDFTYAKDKNNVYAVTDKGYDKNKRRYGVEKVAGADPQSFKLNVLPYDNKYVYAGGTPLISSEGIEFLAIFSGYRPGCGMDRTPSSNYFFMRNKDGYWLIETTYSQKGQSEIQYLGKTFNRKWNPVFEDFELSFAF